MIKKMTKIFLIIVFTLALTVTGLASELDEVKEELEENEAAQEENEKDIAEYEAEIAELSNEIDTLKAELEEDYELMELRIQAFYENFGDGIMEALLGDGSFAEAVGDVNTCIDLAQYDREQLDKIAEETEELEEKQEEMLALLDDAYLEQERLLEEQDDLQEEYDELYKAAYAVAYDTDDLTLFASLIYCEAGGECYEGKLAVACVVVNRIKSSKYPDTLSGVIYQSGQFSPVASGRLATVIANGLATDSCYEAAEYVLAGNNPYPTFLSFRAASVSVSHSYTQIGNQKFW